MLQGKAGLPAPRRPQPLNERTNGRGNGRTGHRIPRIIVVHVSSAVCGVGQRGPSSSLAVAAKAITSLAVHAVPPLLPSLLPPFGSSLPWLYQRESDDTALNGGGCVAVGTKVSAMMVAAVAVCRLRTSLPEQCSLHVNDFSRAAAAALAGGAKRKRPFLSSYSISSPCRSVLLLRLLFSPFDEGLAGAPFIISSFDSSGWHAPTLT